MEGSIKHGTPIFTCNVLAEVTNTNSICDPNVASFLAQCNLNMLLLFIDIVDFIPRESSMTVDMMD